MEILEVFVRNFLMECTMCREAQAQKPAAFPPDFQLSFIPLLVGIVKWSGRILDSLLMSMNELIIHQITTITENNKHALHIDGSWHFDVHSEDY